MKIAWLSDFVCGGLMVVGGLFLLYSPSLHFRFCSYSFVPVSKAGETTNETGQSHSNYQLTS